MFLPRLVFVGGYLVDWAVALLNRVAMSDDLIIHFGNRHRGTRRFACARKSRVFQWPKCPTTGNSHRFGKNVIVTVIQD